MVKKVIKSVNLLPEILRSDKNSKFLSSTIDQLIQPTDIQRLDGYVGSKITPTYREDSDIYISEKDNLRKFYQLTPSLTINDIDQNIKDVITFDDLINQISSNGGNTSNLNRLFRPEVSAYDPHIDWDKLINFQEYYWLTNGPDTVAITGERRNSTSTFLVTDNELKTSFIFSNDVLIEDPLITLYRGNTYNFEINSQYNFYVKTSPSLGINDTYTRNIINNGVSEGTITLVIDDFTPTTLFYSSDENPEVQGKFIIKNLNEDSFIDVEKEIIGKKNYISRQGVELSNGMKIKFLGSVLPEKYQDKEFYVEGVGNSIVLVDINLLSDPISKSSLYADNFDLNNFDEFPFDNFKKLPIIPEYITINRASNDLNPWSRYNRWFHKDIIEKSARINNKEPVYNSNNRARRPIIEFRPDLKLYNFGSKGIKNIDVIDTSTQDAFSDVEGSSGYFVDGILLEQGHRVIFNADTDDEVRGKIYQVNYVKINGSFKLELNPADDYIPQENFSVSVNLGNEYSGTSWYFNGSSWIYAQQHDKLNQPPLFDLFDSNGISYSDSRYYSSNFKGNKIFGYDIGTGQDDPVLGFPLNYKNVASLGSYLFKNYFVENEISISLGFQNIKNVSFMETFLKYSKVSKDEYKTIWANSRNINLPIVQLNTIDNESDLIELTTLNKYDNTIKFHVYINDIKIDNSSYNFIVQLNKFYLKFNNLLKVNDNIVIKQYTNKFLPSNEGFYELPISIVNNPLNGNINSFTLSELGDNLKSITENVENFKGLVSGSNNLRDIANLSYYGSRLISNVNPISFANFFLGKKDYNLLNFIEKAEFDYTQFKSEFVKKLSELDTQKLNYIDVVDEILKNINKSKDILSQYYLSDMIPYGTDKFIRSITIKDSNIKIYPISDFFNLDKLSFKSVLVYYNNTQLIVNKDYKFLENQASLELLINLNVNDTILIVEYKSTEGNFIPPTPTKLGLYPKFEPKIYLDNTYADQPINVIQGHDGSIVVAYNDFRDNILLELEKRIFNNIKVSYNKEIFDITAHLPGAFRKIDYSLLEFNSILQKYFVKWTGIYGLNYINNDTYNDQNLFTWNYTGSYSSLLEQNLKGSWRAIYKYLFDTDRPHTNPWEMLGFSEKPDWWEEEYGPAPYTSGNEILWDDLEKGFIKKGKYQGKNTSYERPGLSSIIPVDEYGNLLDPTYKLLTNITAFSRRQSWKIGDISPVENAWRRSSHWPFVIQKTLLLMYPSTYCSLMYDPSNLYRNIAGNLVYKKTNSFLTLKNLYINEISSLTNGYSVYVSEIGTQRNSNFISELKDDLAYLNYNLSYKLGGFSSKEKIQINVDSYDLTGVSNGGILPLENYKLFLNHSNPIKVLGISGIIIQKKDSKFIIKGYDTNNPYFIVNKAIRSSTSPAITIGGVSEPYLIWEYDNSSGNTGLTSLDLTTANSVTSGKFYQEGQIVLYGNNFYRTKISHRSDKTFNLSYFQILPVLPTKGGVSVQLVSKFSEETEIYPYGHEFERIQDVYDFILGYGKWLENNGFIFDTYNQELNLTIDWNFSAKEFLYWTSQSWTSDSIITLSPFSQQIKLSTNDSVVDNLFNNFYDYTALQADGSPIPKSYINVSRNNDYSIISTLNFDNGIYFVSIKLIQKEHVIVLDNVTLFNDIIYNQESGYRQKRIKLYGFKTANWNGDYFSPGFVYDNVKIEKWKEYKFYRIGEVVQFGGKYFSANENVEGSSTFDFSKWSQLRSKPSAQLYPNFDYKINQFEDFYSLDIDNFDVAQQKMAQHLVGYTPRVYLNSIIKNPISQYKFYQGFIKEKGTKNSIKKLSKASSANFQGELEFNEEWAFRIGYFGGTETKKELEFKLKEGKFIENPQVITLVNQPIIVPNDLIYYSTSSDRLITPDNFIPNNTFSQLSDYEFPLMTAGYVRLDDVTATAYNENSLLDIANADQIIENDVIWLGFKKNGDWDVLRYSLVKSSIVKIEKDLENSLLIVTTEKFHTLTKNDIISIVRFSTQVDGVFIVNEILSLNSFTVTFTASLAFDFVIGEGLLYKFDSSRFKNFDLLYNDERLLSFDYGTKFWIDNYNNQNKWAVLEKVKNYGNTVQNSGWKIEKSFTSNIVITGDTTFTNGFDSGKINIFEKINNELNYKFSYILNSNGVQYFSSNLNSNFGNIIIHDDIGYENISNGIIYVGANKASNIRSSSPSTGLRFSDGSGNLSGLTEEGLVKLSSIDLVYFSEKTEKILLSPNPSNYEQFGSSVFVEKSTGNKLLLVGAPGTLTTGSGAVYNFTISSTDLSITYNGNLTTSTSFTTGSQWGYDITGSEQNNLVAISAPGFQNNKGIVLIYKNNAYLQTIELPIDTDETSRFGEKIKLSITGKYLIISAPYVKTQVSSGKVFIFEFINNKFELNAIIDNPDQESKMNFGIDIDIDKTETKLIISSLGVNKFVNSNFDLNNIFDDETLFDSNSTAFYDNVINSGSVYFYSRIDERFVLVDEIFEKLPNLFNYGSSIKIDQDVIYCGAKTEVVSNFYQFTKLDNTIFDYKILRQQENVIDYETIQKVKLINLEKEQIIDYLDIIDPLKGKISGLAEQELTFRSSFDPAVYSVGTSLTVNNPSTAWLDEHLGELWWDLSTVKYIWYEQGDLIYRKNNWGSIFPGSSIDVYEWVESDFLPSEWSSLADTSEGLTKGLSGQPKHPDNSVVSVKQIYDPISGTFISKYYFWVKNKITLPNNKNRRISSFQVAVIIANPSSYGIKYIAPISNNSLIISNINNILVSDKISINLLIDNNKNSVPTHTEWLLLQEGSDKSVPNFILEKKLIDSLLGRDNLGNPVPDPLLTEREKYGISIRPRQSIFKNRFEALRNLVEFANSILIKEPISVSYNFSNLLSQEPIPDIVLREYDQIVDDIEILSLIDTKLLRQAKISCTVQHGKIRSVKIDDKGFGYKVSPVVKIVSNTNSSASITLEIDNNGSVISANIDNQGENFVEAPILEVRPYTVMVMNDEFYSGRWSKFIYNYDGSWTRKQTQKYNTSLYWKYVDWQDINYNSFIDYTYTLDNVYEINTINDVLPGQYVKINNGGNNNYIILEKTDNVLGTFNNEYNLVYCENGTIQILDTIWNTKNNNLGFDQTNSFDQTLFDQTPDVELVNILTALKEDIFINKLKVNWNLFFFKAVKYALTEQKLLDWAFKTSFINVKNYAGLLDNRPVFNFQNSEYYEEYLKEIKPFRSKIRSFTTNYEVLEPTNTFTTDFDLPTVYNFKTNMFDVIDLQNPIISEYPWKSWYDNYDFEIESIYISYPGEGYVIPPVVEIITADGDTGYGATATAYIRSGKISLIEVTNSGKGYKVPPLIKLTGGGNVTVKHALVFPKLSNKKVRNTLIGIKFDRISKNNEIGDLTTVDNFNANGSANEFLLNWLADPDKSSMQVYLNNELILKSEYIVEFYTEVIDNITKKYSKLKFLNFAPENGSLLTVYYRKNSNIFYAVDRINNFYQPNVGMPGNDLSQLMYGIDYNGTKLETLPFNYTSNWDISYAPFGNFSWADSISKSIRTTIINTLTTGSNVLELSSVENIEIGDVVNVISYINNKFSTTTDVLVTSIITSTNAIEVNSSLTSLLLPGDKIEFWKYNFSSSVLDTEIDGGTWSLSTSNYLIGALGINPEDINIDGNKFYDYDYDSQLEEFVPGNTNDALAINVYTKISEGVPFVFTSYFTVKKGEITTSTLSILPPNVGSITVVYNGERLFGYNETTNFSNNEQFSIIWNENKIVVPPQPKDGVISYTIITVGGGVKNENAGVIDNGIAVAVDESEAEIRSLTSFGSVKSVLVTVNGKEINQVTTSTDYGYILTFSDDISKRATVKVINLSSGTNTVQAWFFAGIYSKFNFVKEEIFTVTNYVENLFNLSYPPDNREPVIAQMIVETVDNTGRKILLPPYVSYYDVSNSLNSTFKIDKTDFYPTTVNFSLQNTEVFLNGEKLRPGFDFSLNSIDKTITIAQGKLNVRDEVAIVSYIYNNIANSIIDINQEYYYDYTLRENQLRLVNGIAGAQLRVLTYTNHDSLLMRTDRFKGTPSRRYKISRPILNDRYIWVQVDGVPLTSKVDYEILDDQMTVQISDALEHTYDNEVVIMSINSAQFAGTVLGYRIFNDIFNRTHFKRLPKENTTYLTKPLFFTDTEIHVAESSVLTPPVLSKKIPGVVLINGERIEFLEFRGNVLTKLRRATLGTSPSYYSEINTRVIDQSPDQNIPFRETIYKQKLLTTSTTNTYVISTVTNLSTIGDGITLSQAQPITLITSNIDSSLAYKYANDSLKMVVGIIPVDLKYDLNGDGFVSLTDSLAYLRAASGISLGFVPSTSSNFNDLYIKENIINNPIHAVDQVLVYYGGRLLNKSGTIYSETLETSNDYTINIIGTTSTVSLLPTLNVEIGDAYIVEDSNQVWVYNNSLEIDAINGFIHRGLKYIPPEFTINTSTQEIILNIRNGVASNIELIIMKKEFARNTVWNNEINETSTLPLFDSTTMPAMFIKDKPSELPDSYYYGGDPVLRSDSGLPLTDVNGNILEGF